MIENIFILVLNLDVFVGVFVIRYPQNSVCNSSLMIDYFVFYSFIYYKKIILREDKIDLTLIRIRFVVCCPYNV